MCYVALIFVKCMNRRAHHIHVKLLKHLTISSKQCYAMKSDLGTISCFRQSMLPVIPVHAPYLLETFPSQNFHQNHDLFMIDQVPQCPCQLFYLSRNISSWFPLKVFNNLENVDRYRTYKYRTFLVIRALQYMGIQERRVDLGAFYAKSSDLTCCLISVFHSWLYGFEMSRHCKPSYVLTALCLGGKMSCFAVLATLMYFGCTFS